MQFDATESAKVMRKKYKDLTIIDKKLLLLLLKKDQYYNQEELSEILNVSSSTISRHLRKLRKQGFVERVQKDAVSVHELTNKGFNVSCILLRGYDSDPTDRLHNIKAECTFKLKKEVEGKASVKWDTYTMKNWIKYHTRIKRVYVWYAETEKGEEGTIHYQLPQIPAKSPKKALEIAFKLIKSVNEELKKDGFVFTDRPQLEHEQIKVTDKHDALLEEPMAVFLKKHNISYNYKDIIEYDASKDIGEMDVTNIPQNCSFLEKYIESFVLPVMKGEISFPEDLGGAKQQRKKIEEKIEQQRQHAEEVFTDLQEEVAELYETQGHILTGQTTQIHTTNALLSALKGIHDAADQMTQIAEELKELKEAKETKKAKEELTPYEQLVVNAIESGATSRSDILTQVRKLHPFSSLPRRKVKREVTATLASLTMKGVIRREHGQYRRET